jgi:hypothetical protein
VVVNCELQCCANVYVLLCDLCEAMEEDLRKCVDIYSELMVVGKCVIQGRVK